MLIIKALNLASKGMSASIYKKAIQKAMAEVFEGIGLSKSLKASGLFPAMLTQMTSTGEKSGELGKLLVKAASYYEREFDSSVARAMVLIVGLIVTCHTAPHIRAQPSGRLNENFNNEVG